MKMKKCSKKIISLLLAVILCASLVVPTFAAGGVSVYLDGEKLTFDVEPTIVNGSTMVPMRAIFEALGAIVEWDGATRTAYAQKGSISVGVTIGDTTLYKIDLVEEKLREMYKLFPESTGLWIQAQHILIMKTEDSIGKKTAEMILSELRKDPTRFDEFVEKYNEDPGVEQQPAGYVFTEGDMVDSFYKGALNTKVGAISGIVESEYGYHIIKKVNQWDDGIPFELVADQVANIYIYNNTEQIKLNVPAQLIGGRTLVPLRAVSEALDCEVKWDGVTRTVNIYSPK